MRALLWALLGFALINLGPSLLLGVQALMLPSWPLNGPVWSVITLDDGGALLGGAFTEHNIVKRDAEGHLDPTFMAQWSVGGFNSDVHAMTRHTDDTVIVGGAFTAFDTKIAGRIIKLSNDGRVDEEFLTAIGAGFDGTVLAVQTLPDKRIVVGGDFGQFNGFAAPYFAVLNADGSFDSDAQAVHPNGAVRSIAVGDDGSVTIGGDFTLINGKAAPAVFVWTKG